ncbi:hypothetical protein ACFOZ0_31575 [Streptomyces yaanensis]|uniref:Uncharacterized protein n=1 Tax=Streptomyces yaanensis TaxID=1142239 RepID=A0ABV7SL56_9ACTN|nr:hypothetical protein [Streptomyces sp. CGMCC 4.7035]WNC02009.1 hypothetical protein Q2K21_30295 [Streptomyces sp. CGMCC 4.7035]
MFQDAPIYQQLIKERGDVPAQVRGEAERILRDLSRVVGPLPAAPAYPVTAQGYLSASSGPALPPGRPLL